MRSIKHTHTWVTQMEDNIKNTIRITMAGKGGISYGERHRGQIKRMGIIGKRRHSINTQRIRKITKETLKN